MYSFRGSIASDLDCVKSFLASTLEELSYYIKDELILFEIRLILSELVINSVKHGNCQDLNKKVYLGLSLDGRYLIISVKDEGEGIKYKLDRKAEDNLECSGRGLVLVEALTESLILHNNEVVAIKKI